ncbi:MAG: penicillin-binding transpeptidase domain-containing protein [Eubacteriales bacterium]
MGKILKTRYGQASLVILILMFILFARLFVLTVVENAKWKSEADNLSIKSIYTKAPRGEILDRYGRVIAANSQIFTLQISVGNEENEELNEVCSKVIDILERNNETYFDNFPILINDGGFEYIFDNDVKNWLDKNEMPQNYTAKEAFEELRRRYNITDTLDKYGAQEELQNIYKTYPPISVKNMQFIRALDKEGFLGRYKLDYKTVNKSYTAKEAFEKLREKFEIDGALSDEEARKIMVLRNELNAAGYRKYLPADVAKGISAKTIIEIEENSAILPQVKVVSETQRVYPNGNTASHILGYLGKISEREKKYYVEKLGYNSNDLIGQGGIESVYETTLKGKDGVKYVRVNANGKLVSVISEEAPKKGKDIYLTIDLELQKIAENALKQALEKLQVGGTYTSEFGNYKYSKAYKNAKVGAVVAVDVKNSDVLAMASVPDFDPNLFSGGISAENWDALQSQNPRDQLAPAPLYNVATRTAVQPGSTFKMITGIAAVESGLNPKQKIYADGKIMISNRPFACWLWHMRGGVHGYLDLPSALEVSCNYYFYDVGYGRDFYKGQSLGYKKPITIDTITSYARQFGLGEPTGIEIPEQVSKLPTEEQKVQNIKNSLKYDLTIHAEKYFVKKYQKDKTLLAKSVDEIVSWTEENPNKKEILDRLAKQKLGVKESAQDALADLCKFTYFNYAKWTMGDQFNISIGQGENSYTPLQMANYIATIGNGGVHNKVSIIKSIEGEGIKKRPEGIKVKLENPETLSAVTEGMKKVVKGSKGSLRSLFVNFPISVAGKTGTAQRAGKMHPADEVLYIQQNLSRINPKLKWEDVEAEMLRLVQKNSKEYSSKNVAVRQAVINLSEGKLDYEKIDAYKSNYDNFAWVVTMAPAEDPKIAVAVLLFQGGEGTYAGPIAKEVIGKYLQLDKTYDEFSLDTAIN